MNILGISCYYHDSAAALLQNGEVIAAEEERFSRKKFDDEFPENAIQYCLSEGRITKKDVDLVAFYDKSILKFERLIDNYIAFSPKGLKSFSNIIPKWLHQRLWISDTIRKFLDNYKGEIIFPEHHLSHAAYAYYTSPFDDSAILTVDGVGEWSTISFGYAKKNKIQLKSDIRWPHSLGLFYSAFTYYMGFKVNEGEYKLMGLSSYGEPKYYDLILNNLIDVKNDGSFHLNMDYFAFPYDKIMINKKFEQLFDTPRVSDSVFEEKHFDIAASAQKVLEDILLKIVYHVYKLTQKNNLCYAGGVALNGIANSKLLNDGPFENIYIPPSPGDAGSAIGCALFACYSYLKNSFIPYQDSVKNNLIYLGPNYTNDEIFSFLSKYKIPYKKFEKQELLEKTAELISKKKIVGWYQNRSEWGPRALGNRSILADPRFLDMKDIINNKIKHRESFRPFAPSIIEEKLNEYFDFDIPSPHMLFVVKVKKPELIPAVTHIDGSARIQTVSKKSNPLYYELITEFFKLSGVPILLNTSMNVMGEPIVNTPKEAFEMLLKTDLDYLVLGNYLISKNDE